MTHAIEGPAMKLIQAYAHLDSFKREVSCEDSYPGASGLAYKTEYDREATTFVGKLGDELEYPPIFALLIGDVLHNLRSCLDHLVFQLARKSGVNENKLGTTQFPIVDSSNEWCTDRVGLMLKHVDADDRTLIEHHQPFHADVPENHVLSVLRRFSNQDKHRLLHPVAAHGIYAEHELAATPIDCVIVSISQLPVGVPLNSGTEVVRIKVRETGPRPRMAMNSEIRCVPAFAADKQGLPVEHVLTKIATYVSLLLGQFSERFPQSS